jgi:hypothetical protein
MLDVSDAPQKLEYQKVKARRAVDWAAVVLAAGIALVISGAAVVFIFYFFVWYTLKMP